VQEGWRPAAEPDARAQEVRVVHREGRGHQAAVQELLFAVKVEEQLVEEVGALAETAGEAGPLVGADEQRQHVERPQLAARALAAVDVHADVLLDDGAVAGVGGGAQGGRLVAVHQVEELAPRRPQPAGPVDALIKPAALGGVAVQDRAGARGGVGHGESFGDQQSLARVRVG
jgi:hypothetical protein